MTEMSVSSAPEASTITEPVANPDTMTSSKNSSSKDQLTTSSLSNTSDSNESSIIGGVIAALVITIAAVATAAFVIAFVYKQRTLKQKGMPINNVMYDNNRGKQAL